MIFLKNKLLILLLMITYIFPLGGIGISAITDLAVSRPMRLIGLSKIESERLETSFPEYSRFTIPEGSYRGIEVDVDTLGIWSAVVVHESMEKDLVLT